VNDYPDVMLDIRFMDSEAACKSVLTGELQLAIVTLPPTGELEKIAVTKVWPDPLVFAAGPDHPLAELNNPTLADLATWPAVLPSRTTYTRRILEQAMTDHDLVLNVSMSTNYLETLKMLAGIGLGWSLIPASMLDATVVALNVQTLRLQRELGIVVHQDRSLSNAEQAMIKVCQQR
jgi:DNA-binding transcriptional LysR family regulator